MNYQADESRYESMRYQRAGTSGLLLPALSLGLWQNFGASGDPAVQRSIILRAFDLGITHFDLANNYGPPPGAAESVFGAVLRKDLRRYRDEIVVSTKAGYLMWPGPYGEWGSAKHLLSSLDQSLARLGLDYVDIFYSHRPDPDTPLDETMGALATAVARGKAFYLGVSNYSPEQSADAFDAAEKAGARITVYQPRYSLFVRAPEEGLFDVGSQRGAGAVVFSPLAQGLLTDRYLGGVSEGSRATSSAFLSRADITPEYLERAHALNGVAAARGQTLAELALSWVLRHPAVTSAIIGASSVRQLEQNVKALSGPAFSQQELDEIDALSIRAEDGEAA